MPLDAVPAFRQRRRQSLVDSAARLFAAQGYAAVQMDEIARAAGMGKATLYRYFRSKGDLYLEALDGSLAELEAVIGGIAAAPGAPDETLERMLRALVASFGDHLGALKEISGDDSALAERHRGLLRRRSAALKALLQSVIVKGVDNGTLRACDAAVVPSLLLGMVRGGIMATAAEERRRVADALVDMALHGGLGSGRGPRRAGEDAMSAAAPGAAR